MWAEMKEGGEESRGKRGGRDTTVGVRVRAAFLFFQQEDSCHSTPRRAEREAEIDGWTTEREREAPEGR